MLRPGAARAGLRRERLLALLEVGVGEGDHRFVEVRVVGDLGAVGGERLRRIRSAGVRSSLIGAIEAERAAAGTVLTIFPAGLGAPGTKSST